MTLKEMSQALKELQLFLEWEYELIDDFHKYAKRFGGTPAGNVLTFALEDALRHRGLTLEQFRLLETINQEPSGVRK